MKNEPLYTPGNASPETRKRSVRRMFDAIVPTYDLLNRILSFGIDRSWRRMLVRRLGYQKGRRVLDLCAGTGDLTRQIRKTGALVYSLDFSLPMLVRGIKRKWLAPATTVAADASRLPFKDATFAAATIAFGIRNIPDVETFLAETRRVLISGGTLLVLELTRPNNSLVQKLYRFYLEGVLPAIGGLISGKKEAYRYLSESIAGFMGPDRLMELARANGFSGCEHVKLTAGIASLYLFIK